MQAIKRVKDEENLKKLKEICLPTIKIDGIILLNEANERKIIERNIRKKVRK